jgi:hypothetical protein
MQAVTSPTRPLSPLNAVDWESSRRRVRAEFREMPGLALTVAQAQRLWSFDRTIVERLFTELVAAGELRQLSDRRFVLARNDR